MSEAKVSCPHCAQSISLDTAWSGQVLNCPVCQKPFTVPQLEAPVSAPPGGGLRLNIPATPPPAASQPGAPGRTPPAAPTRTSGLAIASFALSLLGCFFVTAVAGVICGHIARKRLRYDASLAGGGFATAGLVIGYLMIALSVGGGVKFILDVKHRVHEIQAQRAGQTPAPGGPAGVTIRSSVPAPADAVSGTVKGEPFKFTRSSFSPAVGSLEIDGRETALQGSLIEIFLNLKPGENIENRTWHITPTTASAPAVFIVQMHGGASTKDRINGGYQMDLTTGQISGGMQAGTPGATRRIGGTITGTITLKITGAAPVDIKGNFTASVN